MVSIFGSLFDSPPDNLGSPMVRDLEDILGGAETEEEFVELLIQFLTLCKENGIHLNPSKFNIAGPGESLIFAGIKVSDEGFTVDLSRLSALRDFPLPQTRKSLQQWLGLVNSLNNFASSPMPAILTLQHFATQSAANLQS